MYILGFPQVLTEIGLWFTFVILFIAFVTALSKLSIGRKIFQHNISHPLAEWQQRNLHAATKPFETYVKFHLGPNGTTTPVHERLKQLENRSVIGEIRQRRFMDNIDVLIAESDANGHTNFVNLALCDLMECDPEDWYGDGWKNFIAKEMLDAEVERWESVRSVGAVNPFHHLVLVTKQTQKRIPVRARSYPLHVSGEVIGYVGEMHPLNEEDGNQHKYSGRTLDQTN